MGNKITEIETVSTRIIFNGIAFVVQTSNMCECGNILTNKETGVCNECSERDWHSTQFHPQIN